MELVKTLIERDQDYAEASLPEGLRELYDRDLRFRIPPAERPFVIGNFNSRRTLICTSRRSQSAQHKCLRHNRSTRSG